MPGLCLIILIRVVSALAYNIAGRGGAAAGGGLRGGCRTVADESRTNAESPRFRKSYARNVRPRDGVWYVVVGYLPTTVHPEG